MSQSLQVLIAGSHGQLAQKLTRKLAFIGHRPVAMARPRLDLADVSTIPPALSSRAFDVVVNTAAYTAVDKAEVESETATAVYAAGAGALAAAAGDASIPIIHVSTDYVFDGTKNGAYVETDPPAPLGVYGRSKLDGERLVAQAQPRHIILRTSWVFSAHGNNFVKTMLRLSRERTTISVVDDQYGCPTAAGDLADTIVALLPHIMSTHASPDAFGLLQATGRGTASWFSFAEAIMTGAAKRGAPRASVISIKTADYPTRARRPAHSVLDSSKLRHVHGIEMPPWQRGLKAVLDELVDQVRQE